MQTPFPPSFEFKLHKAMQQYLPGFDGSNPRPQTIELTRNEILNNFSRLQRAPSEDKEEVISRFLFNHMYGNSRDRDALKWVREEMQPSFKNVVDAAILIAKGLVNNPESRQNPEVDDLIVDLKENMELMVAAYVAPQRVPQSQNGNSRRAPLPR